MKDESVVLSASEPQILGKEVPELRGLDCNRNSPQSRPV